MSIFVSTPAMSTTYEEIDIDRIYTKQYDMKLMNDGSVIWVNGTKIHRKKDGHTETIWDNYSNIDNFLINENGVALWEALELLPSGSLVQTLYFYDGEAIHKLDYLPDEMLFFGGGGGGLTLLPGLFKLYFTSHKITSDGKAIWVTQTTRTECALKYFDGTTVNIIREEYPCRHKNEVDMGWGFDLDLALFGSFKTNDQGQIVWIGRFPESDLNTEVRGEVYFFDGTTTTRLTHTAEYERFPVINNQGQLAWVSVDEQNKRSLSIYTESGIVELADSADSVNYVINDNNQVAWLLNNNELYFYESDIVLNLPTQGEIHNLQLNNGGWLSWNNESYDLFLYKEGKLNSHINHEYMGGFGRELLKANVLNNGHAFVPTKRYSGDGDIFYYNGEEFENITGIEETSELKSNPDKYTETAKTTWVTFESATYDPVAGCHYYLQRKYMWINIFDGTEVYRHRHNSLLENPCEEFVKIVDINDQGDVLFFVRHSEWAYDLKLLKSTP